MSSSFFDVLTTSIIEVIEAWKTNGDFVAVESNDNNSGNNVENNKKSNVSLGSPSPVGEAGSGDSFIHCQIINSQNEFGS